MKSKNLQKMTAMAVLVTLLLGVVGMMKGYAYNVTIGTISNGTVVANPTTANEGDTVTLTAAPGTDVGSGYFLQSWLVLDGNNDSIAIIQGDNPNIGTFIMPSSDVTVTATFERTYWLYLLSEDFQACEDAVFDAPGRGEQIATLQLPDFEGYWDQVYYYYNGRIRNSGMLWLAQNEKEGFQLFYRELEKERNLRIEVSPFLNSQNEVLQQTVYWEDFFYAEGLNVGNYYVASATDSLAEALIPYNGEIKRTSVGHNKAFFIELKSTKDQAPGQYNSTITVYDGNTVLATRTVKVVVWNFALPDNHYSEVVMGLYNCNSGYNATSSIFRLNGITVDANGNIAESDLPAAKQILDGYHECLLEHGVSTYEIPRWKMTDDPKAAELTMADPRRKVFAVPANRNHFNGTDFSASAQEVIANYKNLVYDNPLLKDKAFFYPMDEPAANQSYQNLLNAMTDRLADLWPGYHAVVPFNGDYSQTISMLDGKTDILCPNQSEFDPYGSNYSLKQSNFEDFIDRDNHPDRFRTWRYQGDAKSGGTYFWIYPLQTPGVMRRVPFWQQYLMNSDGWLQWNCAHLPNDWTKKCLPSGGSVNGISQTGNGDGILLYPGTMFGQSAETPIVSLRLKQLAAGLDDYDYIRLGEEFLDEESLDNTIRLFYSRWNDCKMLNKEYGYYAAFTYYSLQKARFKLGQLLSAANTEHTWGEWQTAVLPDNTHNGLEICTCSHCGAQESREKTFLYRFVGTEDNQWANLNNWEGNPETLPSSGEAVVIAHDCEIGTNTTVFNVIVNDGINLTVNEGATLTSVRMSTGEDAQVIIEDGAQLYTHSEGVQATVKKNIAPHGDTDGWYLVSTSLASDVEPSMDNGMVPATEESRDLYRFDQSEYLEWRNYQADSFNLENGQGYLYASQSETTLNFIGQINASNANISVPIFYGSGTLAGLNLVGNPFASDAYLMDENNEIMPFYRMNETGDTIVAVQAGTAIKPCEGVFVICPNDRETHSVIFTTTAPGNIGEAQDVPPVSLPQHGQLVNQDAFPDSITQTATLSEGWNWFSTYIEAEDPVALFDMLKAALGNNGLQIESANSGGTLYLGDGEWFGDLDCEGIYNEQMYLIEVAAGCTIHLQGVPADPAEHQITIYPGWNWIGFPSLMEIPIAEMFAGFQPEEEDLIESILEESIYIDGEWIGSGFEALVPGQGFMYFSNSTETKILVFPAKN